MKVYQNEVKYFLVYWEPSLIKIQKTKFEFLSKYENYILKVKP